MNNVRKALILIIMTCIFFIASCTKYDELVPFYDGLFLEYSAGLKLVFNVHDIENSNYKIIESEIMEGFSDKNRDIFVDMYGMVYESTFKDYEGKYSFIWIPVNKMEIGDTFNKGYKVLRKDRWKKWDVLVVKNPYFDEERYFELNTGYLVGVKGNVEVNLVNTNADIPMIE